jgi:hypothetical protein
MDDEARDTIERFHEALNRRDLDALLYDGHRLVSFIVATFTPEM